MSTVQQAEQLWARAHELVRKGDLANAVRDLASCFQILQSLRDPRLYEVHKRWTEVHQMYLKRAQASAAPTQPTTTTTTTQAAQLQQQQQQAAQQALAAQQAAAAAQQAAAAAQAAAELAARQAAELAARQAAEQAARQAAEQAARQAAEQAAREAAAQQAVAHVAPVMAKEDAPVGMVSLDVPMSVGDTIDATQADQIPLEGVPSTPPRPAISAAATFDPLPDDALAALEEMSRRVQQNRRAPSTYAS